MNNLRAAAVQFQHRPEDKAYNLGKIESFTARAASERVELLVFPEMCLTGYWHIRKLGRPEIDDLAEPVPEGPSVTRLLELADRYGLSLGAGLIERDPEGRLFNTYVVAMPGGNFARHRKLHCFISGHMESGKEYTVFDLPGGARAAVLICYDNNIIENVRITSLMGAEVLLAPHQTGGCDSPSPRCMGMIDRKIWDNREKDPATIEAEIKGPKGREWLLRWLPARAHDNGLFLVFANGIGPDDDEVRTGNSMILDPYGAIVAETWKAGDDMVIADLDGSIQPMSTGRRWLKARRPTLYGPIIESTGKERDTRFVRFDRGDESDLP
jgi:predicted amidohydrolase